MTHPQRSFVARASAAAAVGLALLAGSAFADGANTTTASSFNIPNSTPEFEIGTAPHRAFVEGAPTAFVGDFSLYHTGFYSWLIDPGVEATITFETPLSAFSVYARGEDSSVQGSIRLLDVNGDLVAEFTPNNDGFEQLVVPPGGVQIAQLVATNTGTTGRIALDDMVYCNDLPSPSVGDSFCGPAVPNSAGVPATVGLTGSSFLVANQMTLTAEALPLNSAAFFVVSRQQGFAAQPGGSQGNLCLGGTIGRYVGPGQVMNSGATGIVSLPIDLTSIPTPNGPVAAVPGDTWSFQGWYRDSVGGASTSNFTDGVTLTLQP